MFLVYLLMLFGVAAAFPAWGWMAAFVALLLWRFQRNRANYYMHQADLRQYAQDAVQVEIQRDAVSHLVLERARRSLTDGSP